MHGSEQQQPDKATILAELKRIRADKLFASATKIADLLAFVVERTLEDRQHELTEKIIAEDLFGKKLDYREHASKVPDNVVRTTARRLRSKLSEYYSRPLVLLR